MSNKQVGAIIAAILFLAGVIIWNALPESCDHWKRRQADAAFHTIILVPGQDVSSEEQALAAVNAARPEGCY